MELLPQFIVNGLVAGSIYALVASGFSLVFATNKFMHFAHGTCVVLAGYLIYTFFTLLHIPFYLAALITIVLSGSFGFLMFRFVYLPLQNKKASTVILLIASLALLIFMQNVIQLVFDADVKSIEYVEISQGIEIIGAHITWLQIVIILFSAILMVLLYLFMQKTKLGRDMRAVADNKELAAIIGINHRRVADYSFIIASSLAGVAGILIGLEQNIVSHMGTMLIVKAFTGSVIGGMGVVAASILGSYILGFTENVIIFLDPQYSGYKDAIAFAFLFIFLLLKPHGIFGVDRGVKK